MSNTRHAAAGAPFRQERYASSEAYKTSLNGLQVAKRCSVLTHDRELAELIWFLQDRSLPDVFLTGGRVGSLEAIASELLVAAKWEPPTFREIWVEELDLRPRAGVHSSFQRETVDGTAARLEKVAELAAALRRLALEPVSAPAELPGLGRAWRSIITGYREQCRRAASESLAPTSIAKVVTETLKFAREIGKNVLIDGPSDVGKSACAKAFCAASGGVARYVLVPENSDMEALYREVASALGVANAQSYKAADIRDSVERLLKVRRPMLVFDEAHNLFSGFSRVTMTPKRVLWIRTLTDKGVPVAFVALPEFETRMKRCVDQLKWDAQQIIKVISTWTRLPETLSQPDFEVLIVRLAPSLSTQAKAALLGAAKTHRGASFVVDTIAIAQAMARKEGRDVTDDDVAQAIGLRPQFGAPVAVSRRRVQPAPVPAREVVSALDAAPVHASRMAVAQPLAIASRA